MTSTLTLSTTAQLSSGYPIPLLGFGVYQNYETKAAVLEAFRAGYRHVDSAQAYRNEAHVGDAVAESGLNRSDIFLTTKCISKTHGYEKTLRGVDTSLQKFGTDYIDLFLIHNAHSGKERRLETYRALQEAKRAGKIRTVGVSNYGVKHLEEIKQAGFQPPAVNQIELHPFCQQRPIVAYCRTHSILIQAHTPLIRGIPELLNHPVFIELSRKHNHDPAQILLRWSLQKGFIPLPKSNTPSHIHSNTHLYDFVLDEEDMDALDGLDRGGRGDGEGAVSWNPVGVD